MARGVSPGQTVTMPKQYVRLSGTRATGRSFDDRVGATAQLIALRRLDRAALKHQVIFIWSVREEIGLEGAAAAAAALGTTPRDRKSTRLNSSHSQISYAVFCLKK